MTSTPAQQVLDSIVALYNARLSPDNQVRKDAEARLSQMQTENLGGLTLAVVVLLRECPAEEIRQQAALHLKQMVKDLSASSLAGKPSTGGGWARLTPEMQQNVKSQLLACLASETENSKLVRAAVCDLVTLLAGPTYNTGWPELQPQIFILLGRDESHCQVSGLQLLSGLVTHLPQVIRDSVSVIAELSLKLLSSEHATVRCECVRLVATVVESEKRSVWRTLQPCVPGMLRALELAIVDPDDEHASKLLITFLDIAEADAAFYAPRFKEFSGALIAVTRNTSISDRLRQLAVELLLTMAEGKPKMCKNSPGFIASLIEVLMEFLVEVEDDPEWPDNDTVDLEEDEDDEDSSNYEVAEGGIDRLGDCVGGEVVLPLLQNVILQYLQTPTGDWRKKHAALTAISQTVEHIPPDEENATDRYLEQVVPICLAQLKDPHPRVRYAACQAIGQASTDTQPLIQELYTNVLVPALVETLDDPLLRVQSHAARALTNFCEGVQPEDLQPFLDSLVDKLLRRVGVSDGTPKPLLSSCVTALAVIACSADKLFVPYYTRVVPAMKEIVRTCVAPCDRSCRERALECITLIALAIGADAFEADLSECMDAILHLWATSADRSVTHNAADQDDSGKGEGPSETINDSLCRMCRVLQGHFVPYLPHVMPRIFRMLGQRPSEVSVEDIAGITRHVSLVSLAGGKTTGMKTHITIEMEQITTLLYTFLATLGESCKEYITQSVDACIPLLEFHYCEKILQNSINILAETFRIARAVANQDAVNLNQHLVTISGWLSTSLEKAFLVIDDDTMLYDNVTDVPRGIAAMLKGAGPNVLSADQVAAIGKRCLKLLESSCQHEEVAREMVNEEVDEDDVADVEGELRCELDLTACIVQIFSALIEHHPDFFMRTTGDACVEFVKKCLKSPSDSSLSRNVGLYVIVELVELGDRARELWLPFLPTLIEAVRNQDPFIRQPAAHGLKLAVKTQTSLGSDVVLAIGRAVVAALDSSTKKHIQNENDQAATDNLVSAVGAMLFNQTKILAATGDNILSIDNLLRLWLTNLPLKADEQEGKEVHEMLVKLVVARNELVMGPNMANVPQLLTIFAEIYKKQNSTPEMDQLILSVIRGTVPNCGNVQGVIVEIQKQRPHQALSKEQVKCLEKVLNDARTE